ncbi:MAG: hypothetical protein QM730_15795 [Anaerolineales bacterium]
MFSAKVASSMIASATDFPSSSRLSVRTPVCRFSAPNALMVSAIASAEWGRRAALRFTSWIAPDATIWRAESSSTFQPADWLT